MKWIKDCLKKIWDVILQQVGVSLFVLLSSAVYLFLKQIKKFQDAIRQIPSDWILTPLIFVVIALIAVIIISLRQKKHISILEREPIKDERDSRMVTHCGVWWKIYSDSEYIEDFPYCTCCDPPKKLSQTEWYPDEVFECPVTKTKFKLFADKVPIERQRIIDGLYRTYFTALGSRVENSFYAERNRLRELNKNITEKELFDKLFQLPPLNKIPKEELEEIRKTYPNPDSAFHFIDRHYARYKHYFKK